MAKFRVADPKGLTFGIGDVLKLTKEQATDRAGSVKALKGKFGRYEVTAPVIFKRGEVLECEGGIPKHATGRAESVTPATSKAAKPAGKAKPARKSAPKKNKPAAKSDPAPAPAAGGGEEGAGDDDGTMAPV